MKPHPPAWTGYKRSVTIEGNAYEEFEYQFLSRHRKLTIHRRLSKNDSSFRRRRYSRTLESIRSNSLKHLKVISLITAVCIGLGVPLCVLSHDSYCNELLLQRTDAIRCLLLPSDFLLLGVAPSLSLVHVAWNNLPSGVTSSLFLLTFKQRLKFKSALIPSLIPRSGLTFDCAEVPLRNCSLTHSLPLPLYHTF